MLIDAFAFPGVAYHPGGRELIVRHVRIGLANALVGCNDR